MNYYLKRTFSTLREFKSYIFVVFVVASVLVAHEHFIPAVKYIFHIIAIGLPGETSIIPAPNGKDEAIMFRTKIFAMAFTALGFLILFGLFFGLIGGLTQVIQNLDELREKQSRYLSDLTKLQKECIDFLDNIGHFLGRQKYEINKCDSAIQTLSIETINLQNTINGLSVQVDQLRAISAALGRELEPSGKSNQGNF